MQCHTIKITKKNLNIYNRLQTIAIETKSIRRINVKLQETIKSNISNKTKNILGFDRVEQFMQRRNGKYLCLILYRLQTSLKYMIRNLVPAESVPGQ